MRYTATARDISGQTLTFANVEIPSGVIQTTTDYANALAANNLILLTIAPTSGSATSQAPAPTGTVNTGVPATAKDSTPIDIPGGAPPALGKVYRLVLASPKPNDPAYPDGLVYDTGALYPGCSFDNPQACKPIQFGDWAGVVYYCQQNNEIPVKVQSAEQAWDIVSGKEPIPAQPEAGLFVAAALIAYKLLLAR